MTDAPKTRPLILTGPMVIAALAGTQTQTRRLVKPQPAASHYLQPMFGQSPDGFTFGTPGLWREVGPDYPDGDDDDRRCPYGVPGDLLYVRESLIELDGAWYYEADTVPVTLPAGDDRVAAMVAWAHHQEKRRCISRHMPRFASRLTLEVTSVRVERLQSISEEDAKAEGVTTSAIPVRVNGQPGAVYTFGPDAHRKAFSLLWDTINGDRASWSSNPWVWVISFRRLGAP